MLGLQQLANVRLAHVVVRVAIDRAPGADEFRIVQLEPHGQRKRLNGIQRQCVEFVVGFVALGDVFQRVRVIVDRFDL